jgi:hypothetical protein
MELKKGETRDSGYARLQDAWIEAIAARRFPVATETPVLVTVR